MAAARPTSSPRSPRAGADALDGLTIPVPCRVPWESMTGDAKRRFCARCRLHVHDLSQMTRDDALALVERGRTGGGVCVQIWRRPDGRVLTWDCRSAVRSKRRRALVVAAALLGVLGLGGFAWVRAAEAQANGTRIWDVEPFRTLAKVLPASWLPAPPPAPPVNVPPGTWGLRGRVLVRPPSPVPSPAPVPGGPR